MIPAGTIINGPDGQGYKVLRPIGPGMALRADTFEALGGAPKAEAHKAMAPWLAKFFDMPMEKKLKHMTFPAGEGETE